MKNARWAAACWKTTCSLALVAVLLVACGEPSVEPTGHPTVSDLHAIEFDLGNGGVSRRFVRVADWQVTDSQEHGGYGAKYDLEVSAERDRLSIECNGMRNLLHVGKGTEAQFRELAATPAWWDTRNLEAPVKELGLDAKDEFRRYWTPVPITPAAGIIFATRSSGPEGSDAGALLFIRHIEPGERVEFIVIKAPGEAPAGSR